jgi:hypothetical protein
MAFPWDNAPFAGQIFGYTKNTGIHSLVLEEVERTVLINSFEMLLQMLYIGRVVFLFRENQISTSMPSGKLCLHDSLPKSK